MDKIYSFVYRGVLTEASLDLTERKRRKTLGVEDVEKLRKALSYEMLEQEILKDAERMSIVYTAVHAFENTVRIFVQKVMVEEYHEEWWNKVPERIKKNVKKRIDDDAKFKWHGARGGSNIMYIDFGDLSSIITTNWDIFENILSDLEWAKAILSTLEKSRNIIMHGGIIEKEDVERIGINIRDWIRQTG